MPSWSRSLLASLLIVLVHLPLIHYTRTLVENLQPGEGLLDIAPGSLILLLALLLLPTIILAWRGIQWNPDRARLNEPLD